MSDNASNGAGEGTRRSGMDEAGNMARLIMDDWKRFFRAHRVPVSTVCRAAKRVIDLGTQAAAATQSEPAQTEQVTALSTRVAELEAELARLRAQTAADQS